LLKFQSRTQVNIFFLYNSTISFTLEIEVKYIINIATFAKITNFKISGHLFFYINPNLITILWSHILSFVISLRNSKFVCVTNTSNVNFRCLYKNNLFCSLKAEPWVWIVVGGANIQIVHYFDHGYLEEEKSMIHSFTVTFGAKYLTGMGHQCSCLRNFQSY
jgi:hypothetical protein